MLGKVLKYDLKWVYKGVGIFYILSFVFSIIGRGLNEIENSALYSILAKISFGFAISMMVNSLINCLMRLWARFIRNMYKDESYLTHTIPVPRKTIYASKVLAGLITIFTTTVVILVCLYICYYSEANMEILKTLLELAASTYNTTVVKLLLLVAVVIYLEIMFMLLIGYTGIILGHKSNKNKIIRTLVYSFILYMVTQVATLAVIYIYGLFNPSIMNIINTTDIINIDAIKTVMYVGIGTYVAYIIFYYSLGKKQLEKGVNVD